MRSLHAQRRIRTALIVSATAGMVIAVWLTAQLVGWSEDQVLSWIPESTALAALVIIALLVADTVLPIPATIVMLGSGAFFGPLTGSIVNAVGLAMAALAGYGLGRAVPQRRYGGGSMRPVLIAATRGLPVLSEAIAIGAGVIGYPIRRFMGPATLGAAAVGILYGLAGWLATNHWSLVILASLLASVSYLIATRLFQETAEARVGSADRAV